MNRRAGYALMLCGVGIFAVTPASAQRGKEDSELAFDVASIKPSPKRTQAQAILSRFPRAEPGGRWAIGYTPLREILGWLYPDYPLERIVGGPPWVDSERFDIEARTSPGTSADRMTLMARRLLMDRFKLRLGSATRPVDVYALVITRNVPFAASPPVPAGQANLPPTSADIFTAVREQLGMNLVPRKEPMNHLTIEQVEMPTPN